MKMIIMPILNTILSSRILQNVMEIVTSFELQTFIELLVVINFNHSLEVWCSCQKALK